MFQQQNANFFDFKSTKLQPILALDKFPSASCDHKPAMEFSLVKVRLVCDRIASKSFRNGKIKFRTIFIE